ncbi:hypothetical protein VNO77_21026 [Canavalia gladiata]|uniref:Uncharacterized protein n=1 Tax=Canavalia gladiata TaxID=3824 RepID=A0AAN9QLR0_CANGL
MFELVLGWYGVKVNGNWFGLYSNSSFSAVSIYASMWILLSLVCLYEFNQYLLLKDKILTHLSIYLS